MRGKTRTMKEVLGSKTASERRLLYGTYYMITITSSDGEYRKRRSTVSKRRLNGSILMKERYS